MTEWKTVKIEADIGPFCVIALGAQGDTGRDKFFELIIVGHRYF